MSEAGQPQDNGQPSSVGKQEPMVEMPEVKPDDSASQCGSESSSTSSVRLRVMARKAALAAEAAALEEQHELELEELRLAQRKSRLSMKTKLQVAEAEERIYLAYENRKLGISSPGMKLGDQKVADDETLPYPDKKVVSTSSPEAAAPKEESGHVPMSESAEFRLPKQGQQARMTADYERAEPSPDSVKSGRMLSSGDDAELVNLMKQGQLQQQRILETVQLPKAELTPYDGNPLGFWEFWRCFEDSVDSALVEDKTKLTRLLHYCNGEPKKLLGPCLLMSSSVGYATAKRLLFERFGDPVQITEAWMKRMTKGKSIGPRDKKALRELADDMNVCLMSFQAMGFEYELSPQRILLPLVERLPLYLKGKWLNRVGAIRRQQRIPGFEDLLSFVQEAAQEMNDPVYGDLMSSQSDPQRSSRSGRSKGSFSTSASERPTETECVQCKGNHKLWDCKRFKEMSPKDRIRFARKKGLCFSCLKAGHMTAGCTKKKTCSVDGCVRQHNKLLHISEQTAEQKTDSGTQDNGTQNTYVESEASCSSTGAGKRGVLPIVPVRVKAEGRQVAVWTYALLDTGSTSSFCSTKLARRLGAKGVKEKLLLTTLECRESAVHTEVIILVVDSGNNSKKVRMSHVYTRDDINVKGIHMAAVDDIKDLNHLKGIDVPVATEDDVGLIIGQDIPEALLPLEVRRGERGPYAVRTCLGWSLHGPLSRSDRSSTTVHATNTFIAEDLCLERQLEKFWKLETPDPFKEERGMSRNDIKALAEWEQGVCIDKGHYQLPIPFKKRPPDLENNRWLAEKRLQSLGRRLYQTEGLLQKYSDGMVELLRKGYAEEVNNHDSENGCKWYLPHHPVLHPMKPGKVRIVFDCASAWKGLSLNDVVYQGPDLTNKLIGVLLRFRCAPVALMADIESMFHQVRVPAADRDVLRFLWWPSGDMKEDPHVYRMCVHLFGGTWSPSVCSYALRKTAEDYESDYSPEVSRIVKHQFYVDDCLVAVADEGAAIRIAEELMSLLKRGGFRLSGLATDPRC